MKPRRLPQKEQSSVTLSIQSLGREGEGLAQDKARRVYVAGALPGETVRATLREEVDRDVFKASLDEIITPSAHRAMPPCPHYESCGGCTLQHAGMEFYRDWKIVQIRERLERAGLAPDVWDEPSFIPAATRRRATFSVLKNGGAITAGFHGARSHAMVPIDTCLVTHPRVMEVLERSKPWLGKILKDGKAADLMIQVIDGQAEAILTGLTRDPKGGMALREAFAGWANELDLARLAMRRDARDEAEIMVQRRPVMAQFGPLSVPLPPGAFLQPSREGEAALTDAVRSMLKVAKAEGPSADLFAGCGTFAGVLLAHGPVHAVELDDAAVRALNGAKAAHKLTVERRNLFTAPLMAGLKKFATVLLDPPRAGALAQVEELAKSNVPTVIYISCNPASFTRDAAVLVKGGYNLRHVKIIDQFIWSAHTELAALFTR